MDRNADATIFKEDSNFDDDELDIVDIHTYIYSCICPFPNLEILKNAQNLSAYTQKYMVFHYKQVIFSHTSSKLIQSTLHF